MSANSAMDTSGKELRVLTRHVPQIVVARFLATPERLRGPESTSFLGAVALFDISGFSSLGSKLNEEERCKSRRSGSNGSSSSAASLTPAAHASVHATGLKMPTSTVISPQPSAPKRKSRVSLPSLSSILDKRSSSVTSLTPRGSKGRVSTGRTSTGRASTGRNSTGRHSTGRSSTGRSADVHAEDEEGSQDDLDSFMEDTEMVAPSDLMRKRRLSSTPTPLGRMSFTHSAKPSAAPQGSAVETLTTTLNKSLEPVIDVILQHGGDIIKFAGDALLVLWETEATRGKTTPAGELTYRAVRCALDALRALNAALATGHEHFNMLLGMHVGIGVSQLTGNHVGGVLNRWEFYLGGDAIHQMSHAEGSARRGEVALSPQAYAALEAEFHATRGYHLSVEIDVSRHESGNYFVRALPDAKNSHAASDNTAPNSPLAAHLDLVPFLRGYVPGTIVSYLRKGLSLTSCTLNVTVAFVKLAGVVEIADARTQVKTIHHYLCAIQECAYKVQGTLRQFIIDDKGAVAIIAIGLPPFYHENNAFRGVKFACGVIDRGIPASIGLTTGSAFCGSVGSSARAEYAMVGDVINLSARLMSAAPVGEIYCDERTHKHTKASVHFYDPVEITVKGKSDHVSVFPVQRLPSKVKEGGHHEAEATYPAPYGCDDVLDTVPLFRCMSLQAEFVENDDAKQVLVVSGDSGTGKTMLLQHVKHYHHARCFKGGGDPVDSAVDFHAWRGIAKKLVATKIKIPHTHNKISLSAVDLAPLDPALFDPGADTRVPGLVSDNPEATGTENNTGAESNLSVHRPSHRGRMLRRNPLATYDEEGSEVEVSSISSSALQQRTDSANTIDTGQLTRQDNSASPSNHVSVLEYLMFKQQVSRATLAALNDLLPYTHLTAPRVLSENKTQPTLPLPPVSGEAHARALSQVLFAMVKVVSATKPVLLIFDNAQWMDDRSLRLVFQVLEELPNVYFLVAMRGANPDIDHPQPMLLGLLRTLPCVTTRDMRRFSYQDTSLFLCQYYHIAIMDTQVLDFAFARTEGNPAALIKLMAFMLEAHYITIDPDNGSIVILQDLDEMDTQVPHHVRARVMSRVDSLDALTHTALKLLSINPQPTEERMLNGVLMLLEASDRKDTSHDAGDVRLKVPHGDAGKPVLHQVRSNLVACEKIGLVTVDAHNNLYFFNSEEIRLVVYDIMLPSQRRMLHALYAAYLRDAATKSPQELLTPPPLTRIGSATSTASLSTTGSGRKNSALRPLRYQQYALLGYHLSRSDSAKEALEAYHLAGEGAFEAKELGFAADCMHSSFKILGLSQQSGSIIDLDYILLRTRIEFIRGAIAVENSDWDLAVSHMAYILRLFHRKGSVLRRYSSNIRREGLVRPRASSTLLTSFVASNTDLTKSTPRCFPIGPAISSTSVPSATPSQCIPRLFRLNDILPTIFQSAAASRHPTAILPTMSTTSSNFDMSPTHVMARLNSGRVQPEEALYALNQLNFYRRKATALIDQINLLRKKQEEMNRDLQKLTRKTMQIQGKR